MKEVRDLTQVYDYEFVRVKDIKYQRLSKKWPVQLGAFIKAGGSGFCCQYTPKVGHVGAHLESQNSGCTDREISGLAGSEGTIKVKLS